MKVNLKKAQQIVRNNYDILERNGDNPIEEDGVVLFIFEGITIYDPFLDKEGVWEVDPVEYYGEAFLKSRFIA